jgi:nucleoside-diphosphate-sugar epimerase
VAETSHETEQNTMSIHVIVGAGAVGTGTALVLAEAGHDVRVVTRSGSGPEHPNVELMGADASDRSRMAQMATGAHAIYNCANPPYTKWATAWPPLAASFLAAAETTGARLVTMSNLYGFAPGTNPMSADGALASTTKKGAIRATMWHDALEAHRAGRIRATEARGSDYVGSGLGDNAHLGDRVVLPALSGKSVSYVGTPDQARSWAYIGDVCATLATLGTDDRALGRAWHVPSIAPISASDYVAALCREAGVAPVKVKQIPALALRGGRRVRAHDS